MASSSIDTDMEKYSTGTGPKLKGQWKGVADEVLDDLKPKKKSAVNRWLNRIQDAGTRKSVVASIRQVVRRHVKKMSESGQMDPFIDETLRGIMGAIISRHVLVDLNNEREFNMDFSISRLNTEIILRRTLDNISSLKPPKRSPKKSPAKPKREPAKVEPAKPEPAKPEPAKPEPAKVEPAKPEPAELDPEERFRLTSSFRGMINSEEFEDLPPHIQTRLKMLRRGLNKANVSEKLKMFREQMDLYIQLSNSMSEDEAVARFIEITPDPPKRPPKKVLPKPMAQAKPEPAKPEPAVKRHQEKRKASKIKIKITKIPQNLIDTYSKILKNLHKYPDSVREHIRSKLDTKITANNIQDNIDRSRIFIRDYDQLASTMPEQSAIWQFLSEAPLRDGGEDEAELFNVPLIPSDTRPVISQAGTDISQDIDDLKLDFALMENVPSRVADLIIDAMTGPNPTPKKIADIRKSVATPPKQKPSDEKTLPDEVVLDIESQAPPGEAPQAIREVARINRWVRRVGGFVVPATLVAIASAIYGPPGGGPPGGGPPGGSPGGDLPDVDLPGIPFDRNVDIFNRVLGGALAKKMGDLASKYKKRKQTKPSKKQLNDIKRIIDTMPPPDAMTQKGIEDGGLQFHLPGYNFLGPGTNIDRKLASGMSKGGIPINRVDEIAFEHDVLYRLPGQNAHRQADVEMLQSLEKLAETNSDAQIAYAVIYAKQVMETKLGMSFGEYSGDPSIVSDMSNARDIIESYEDMLDSAGVEIPSDGSPTKGDFDNLDTEAMAPHFERTNELLQDKPEETPVVTPAITPVEAPTVTPGETLNETKITPPVSIEPTMENLLQSISELSEFVNTDSKDFRKSRELADAIVGQIEVLAPPGLQLSRALKRYRANRNAVSALGDLTLNILPFMARSPEVEQDISNIRGVIQDSVTAGSVPSTTPSGGAPSTAPTSGVPSGGAPSGGAPSGGAPPTGGHGTRKPVSIDPPLPFTAVPVDALQQNINRAQDNIDAQDFHKFRPQLATLQPEKYEPEMEPLADEDIKQETIDFSYVPVRGWVPEGNSIYNMSVIQNNIRYKGAHPNKTGVGRINRVGYARPLEVQWDIPEAKDPHIQKLQKPMIIAGSLGRDVPFKKAEFQLNYNTQPIDVDQSNLFNNHWSNSLYVPDAGRVPFQAVNPSRTADMNEASTDPSRRDNVMSSVGLGFYNFDE